MAIRPRARPVRDPIVSPARAYSESGIAGVGRNLRDRAARIGRDFQHATGSKPYETRDDLVSYNQRTADNLQKAKDRNKSASKKRRDKRSAKRAAEMAAKAEATSPIKSPTETFAENKKRYDDYMAEQERKKAIAAQMPQALRDYERMNRRAGPVPLQMQGLGAFRNPYMQQATSPAFRYAAQNYGRLGGQQRMYDRPMEMMSRRDRQAVNQMAERMARRPMPMPMPRPYPRMPNIDFGKGATMPQPRRTQSDFGRMLESKYGQSFGGGQRGFNF